MYNTLFYFPATPIYECMVKRSQNGGDTVQFSIRLPVSLKEEIDKRVEELDLDLTTWIRHACREKLEREKHPDYSNVPTAKEVYAMIEKAINERYRAPVSAEKVMQRT